MIVKATALRTDGTEEVIDVATLEDLQEAVDGWIEIVSCRNPNQCLVVNEEGWLRSLPANPLASRRAGHIIVGNVLEMTRADLEAM